MTCTTPGCGAVFLTGYNNRLGECPLCKAKRMKEYWRDYRKVGAAKRKIRHPSHYESPEQIARVERFFEKYEARLARKRGLTVYL